MAGIRISGMASGLPADIVDQIMAGEKIPVKNLEAKKTKEDDMLKLVTELETKVTDITKNLGELVGTKGFTDLKLTSGDAAVVEGTADPATAVPGEYQIEVDQLAEKPGAMSNGFPDANQTRIGVGYLKLDTVNGTKEIYISPKNSTLAGMAAQINNAGQGVRATVINDRKDPENPYKLLITGLSTGKDKQVKFPTVYMLDGDQDFFFDQNKPAQNAKVKVDGFEVEIADNVAKDIIPGVTLDLKQAAPGKPIRIEVKENTEVIGGKIKGFVDAYNAALGWIQNQHKLQKGANGRESLGPLGGDSLLRSLQGRLRSIIQDPQYNVAGPIKLVNDLGVEFKREGTLDFKADKFNKVLATDPKAVAAFLRGDGFSYGFVPALKRQLNFVTDFNTGSIPMRKKGIQQKIEQMNKQIETKERQLEKKEEGLRNKFANLESNVSKIQQQGASLQAMQGGNK